MLIKYSFSTLKILSIKCNYKMVELYIKGSPDWDVNSERYEVTNLKEKIE